MIIIAQCSCTTVRANASRQNSIYNVAVVQWGSQVHIRLHIWFSLAQSEHSSHFRLLRAASRAATFAYALCQYTRRQIIYERSNTNRKTYQ